MEQWFFQYMYHAFIIIILIVTNKCTISIIVQQDVTIYSLLYRVIKNDCRGFNNLSYASTTIQQENT
jgi:hypothetical protein